MKKLIGNKEFYKLVATLALPLLLQNTVSTFVRILEDEGYIGHRAFGVSYQYYPLVSRNDYHKRTVRNVISKYFNNSYMGLVSALVKEEEISLDELKELIRQVEEAPSNSPKGEEAQEQ